MPDPYPVGPQARPEDSLPPDDYRDPDIYGDQHDTDDDEPAEEPARRPTHFATGLPADDGEDLGEESDLDAIARELDAEQVPSVTLPIVGRRGWEAVYRIDIRGSQIESWRKRAKTRRGVDAARFSGIALSELCLRILRNGRPIVLDGEEQTFRSRPFMDALKVTRAADAVHKVYGLEGYADAALRAVLRDSGWGEDLEDTDPALD